MIHSLRCDVLFYRGHARAKEGKLKESIEAFDQILAIQPDNCFALLHKAIEPVEAEELPRGSRHCKCGHPGEPLEFRPVSVCWKNSLRPSEV